MAISYEHTQKGGWALWMTVAGLVPVAAMFYFMLNRAPFNNTEDTISFVIAACAAVVACGSLAWAVAMMSALTVRIEDGFLKLRFGAGSFRKKFALDEIISARPVQNGFWRGWGIHKCPGGWIYNIAGFDAVEITMKNGKTNRIGTDEPEKLARAINGAVPERDFF